MAQTRRFQNTSTNPHIGSAQVEELRSQLQASDVLTPDSPAYAASLKRWSNAAEKEAGLVVVVGSAEDISKTILFVQKYGLDLAIVSGGHSTAGAGSTQGGVLINLSKMRHVAVDPLTQTLTVQGGALWEDVDHAAERHGLATVGGVVNHTGVGGLTLGGGYGWLTGQYGLVIDNLLSVQLVTADGQILTASEKENVDLWWAVRGAGHNFGVVTEFTLRAFPQKTEVYAGILGFTPDKLEKVIEFANALVDDENADGRSGIYCFLAIPPGGSAATIGTAVFSNTTEEESKRRFAPLLELEPVLNTTAMVPYSSVNGMLNNIAVHGDRKSMKGTSFSLPVRAGFVRNVFDTLTGMLEKDADIAKSFVVLEFVHMNKVAGVAQTATSFANRGRLRNGGVWLWWTDPGKDSEARAAARHLKDFFTREGEKDREEGKVSSDAVGVYSNFVETGDKSAEEIFGVNLERLERVKAKYDPRNIFNKMHPINPSRHDTV